MRQTELHLADKDRSVVDEIRSKGLHQSPRGQSGSCSVLVGPSMIVTGTKRI